jgi:hypothetical protein
MGGVYTKTEIGQAEYVEPRRAPVVTPPALPISLKINLLQRSAILPGIPLPIVYIPNSGAK